MSDHKPWGPEPDATTYLRKSDLTHCSRCNKDAPDVHTCRPGPAPDSGDSCTAWTAQWFREHHGNCPSIAQAYLAGHAQGGKDRGEKIIRELRNVADQMEAQDVIITGFGELAPMNLDEWLRDLAAEIGDDS